MRFNLNKYIYINNKNKRLKKKYNFFKKKLKNEFLDFDSLKIKKYLIIIDKIGRKLFLKKMSKSKKKIFLFLKKNIFI